MTFVEWDDGSAPTGADPAPDTRGGAVRMPQSNPAARFPVNMHRQVSLVRTSEPIVTEELMARRAIARLVVGRLSDTVLLVRADDEDALLEELRRAGHTPRVVR